MKNVNVKEKKNSGITMVSLAVTIIVLLIIAGITIAALVGDNGLINKAKQSKAMWDNSSNTEVNMMDYLSNRFDLNAYKYNILIARNNATFQNNDHSSSDTGNTSKNTSKNNSGDQTDTDDNDPNTKYYIQYELNGGSISGTGNPIVYTPSEGKQITLKNPVKEGSTFRGWSGTGIDGVAYTVTIPKGSTGNRRYIANWDTPSYQVVQPTGETQTTFTLKDAVDAASSGATINVLAYTYEANKVSTINKELTIDLKGKTIILTNSITIGEARTFKCT